MNNIWTVSSDKIEKQVNRLNQKVLLSLKLLFEELKQRGPSLSD